ncbi:MAG: HPr(Ser) kinase/phosphatase [Oscillospiraceae bacterium]|nr:HPr(Ser) kinase/phosphatase [Oscillospiraceae bacterium]
MAAKFSVSMSKLENNFSLEPVYRPEGKDEILIHSADVNRPGLELAGYMDFFDDSRIQIMGKIEISYIEKMEKAEREKALDTFFARRPPVVIVSRSLDIPEEMMEAAKKYEVAIYRTADGTSEFLSGLISLLNVELAPRITRHGVLVEVYGEGILLLGESGIGKSETAIELVKRGHRLIADDAVEIRRVSNRTLVGSSPENIRHFLEMRGVGIINARRLFGMGAVKMTEKIDTVINLEVWDQNKVYDRMGMENNYTEILGIKVPALTIPVKPGRNLAIIIEVAAMNNRQKKMGYNAAEELLARLGMINDDNNNGIDWAKY